MHQRWCTSSHSANGNRGYGWVQAGMIFPFLDNADRLQLIVTSCGGYGTVKQVPKSPARRGWPPNKNKKPAVTPTSQNTAPDVAFYAPKPTNNSVDKNNSRSLTCDMKKLATVLEKPAIIDNFRWINEQRTEGDTELSGSMLKVLSEKCGSGKKQGVSDENRCKTYRLSQLSTSYDEFPILNTFDQERKLLVSGSVDSEPADVVPGSSLMAKKVLPMVVMEHAKAVEESLLRQRIKSLSSISTSTQCDECEIWVHTECIKIHT